MIQKHAKHQALYNFTLNLHHLLIFISFEAFEAWERRPGKCNIGKEGTLNVFQGRVNICSVEVDQELLFWSVITNLDGCIWVDAVASMHALCIPVSLYFIFGVKCTFAIMTTKGQRSHDVPVFNSHLQLNCLFIPLSTFVRWSFEQCATRLWWKNTALC